MFNDCGHLRISYGQLDYKDHGQQKIQMMSTIMVVNMGRRGKNPPKIKAPRKRCPRKKAPKHRIFSFNSYFDVHDSVEIK